MASITHHLLTNIIYNDKHSIYTGKELVSFLVGAIAPDSARAGSGKDINQKNISHFLTRAGTRDVNAKFNLDSEIPEVDLFLEKYKEKLDDPLVLGYLIHLVTDSYWFGEFLMSVIQSRVKEINVNANSLDELTLGEAFNWYKEEVFKMFNYHDKILGSKLDMDLINEISKYDVKQCPIEEVDKNDLQNLLDSLSDKYFIDADESNLISLLEIENFFITSSQLAYELYDKKILQKDLNKNK